MYTIKDLYDLDHTLAKDYLSQFTYPWEALKGIKDMILALGPTLGDDYEEVSENVWVHKTAKVFPSAYLGAPCIIGPNTEVRHGAFIRSSALVGADCVGVTPSSSRTSSSLITFRHRTITMLATPSSDTTATWGQAQSLPTSSPTRL